VLNLVTGIFLEHPARADMLAVIPAILYTGFFNSHWLYAQVIAQKHTPTMMPPDHEPGIGFLQSCLVGFPA